VFTEDGWLLFNFDGTCGVIAEQVFGSNPDCLSLTPEATRATMFTEAGEL